MEKTIIKTRKMTSYSVLFGGKVIAKADHWPADDGTPAYVIEVVPFEGLAKKAGIKLNSREVWDDFYDSEESEIIPNELEQVRYLMSTIIADMQDIPEQIKIRSRKEVYELGIAVQGSFYDLIMVYQYKYTAEEDLMNTGVFIQNKENYDSWYFSLDTNENEILEKITLSIKAHS